MKKKSTDPEGQAEIRPIRSNSKERFKWEAEELRAGIEKLVASSHAADYYDTWEDVIAIDELLKLLEAVDARDSLAHLEQVSELEDRIKVLEAERIEVQNKSRIVTCVYCGHAYPPGTPTSNYESLNAHIRVCDKHPMSALRREADDLREQIAVLKAKIP